MLKAAFAGSFDPITFGHLNIIKSALSFCDKLLIIIAQNASKKNLLSLDERKFLVEQTIEKHFSNLQKEKIKVISSSNIVVDVAKSYDVSILIRGIRDSQDYIYETKIAQINKTLSKNIQTIFIPVENKFSFISSTIVKQIAKLDGSLVDFVPENVERFIKEKVKND